MADRKLTIRDIARLAGVSRSTVSLVINDDRRISEATRNRVQTVIRRQGYQPNAMARGLARRRAGMVAVVIPRVSSHVFSDFYFSEAMSGIGDTLAGRGCRMLIEMATEDYVREENHLKLFKEGRIDGMLLVGTLTTDSYIQDLARLYPILLVNSRLEGLSSVVADNFEGARKMVSHLVELGHRRIGFIAGIEVTTVGEDRSRGFRAAMRESGLPLNDAWIRGANFSETSGHEACRAILNSSPRPSAIFAANDMMAIGCLKAAREAGLSVPRDLTVVGADDVILASYVTPSLTTFRQPMHHIGRLATEMLMDMPPRRSDSGRSEVDETFRHVVEQVIPTELVIRDSSAPPA